MLSLWGRIILVFLYENQTANSQMLFHTCKLKITSLQMSWEKEQMYPLISLVMQGVRLSIKEYQAYALKVSLKKYSNNQDCSLRYNNS